MQQNFSSRVRTGVLLAGFTLTGSIAFLSAPVAHAQESASISGSVTDPTGAAIPSASVILTNTDTGVSRKVVSNAAGLYHFPNLQPGPYTVSATASGFSTYSNKVLVTVGASITINAPLNTGSTSTTVEVSADAAATVNTDSPEISQVITPDQVSQLPSLTRNPYDFIAITGNVSNGDNSQNGAAQNGANRGVSFSLNGQRNSGTEILLDGVENLQVFNDEPAITVPIDDVLEYRVITNNFAPQYGRASGGVVSVATKGGTNRLHGTLWEFNRISALTANTWANAVQAQPKSDYTRNMFGAAVGGPVIKDKLFFFASAEFLRVRSAANQVAAIPTSQLLAATAANVQSFYSTYAGPVSNSVVSTTTNIQAGNALQLGGPLFPTLSNNTPVFNNVAYTTPQDAGGGLPQNRYNITGRLDYTLGDRTQMFFRYVDYNEQDQSGSATFSPFSQYNVASSEVAQSYLLSVAHEFNSAFSTFGKLSFIRVNFSNSYNTALQNVPTLNLSSSPTDPATGNPFYLPGFYDTTPANGGLPYGGPQNTIQYNQDLAYTKNRHQIQVGGQVLYIQENQAYGAYAQASEQLGKSLTQGFGNLISGNLYKFTVAVNPKGATPCTQAQVNAGGTVPASCAITLPASAPAFARSYRYHDWAAYAQDQWKFTSRFTANYGVRYEYYGIQHNNNQNLDSNFYYGAGSNLFAQVRNGNVYTVPTSPIGKFWNPQYGTVSPRVGFAYDLFGNGQTSFRAGYGISYERNFGNVTFNAIQNPPNYAAIATTYSAASPIVVTNANLGPLAGSSGVRALPPTSLRHIDQNIRTAQTQFWSAAIDQKVGHNSVVEIAYNGSRGIHLYDIKNYNIPGEGNLYLGDSYATLGLTYPNAHFTNDNNRGSNGDSYYHAVNVQFTTQDIHHSGLSIVANYTLAHALDDLSTTFSETAAGNFELGYTNATTPALDHGSSDFDLRHRFVLSPIYRTPSFFKDKGGYLAQLLGGYEITGIYTVRTGTPFSLYDSTNNNSGYQVPRYTPSGPINQFHFTKIPSGAVLNGSQYQLASLPGDVPFGNAALGGISDLGPYPANMTSRNPFYGPGAYNLDVSFSKTFPIHERLNLEFRAEGFNVTNHHNLYIIEADDDAANYGTSAYPIIGRKGGAGYVQADDERRFLQFAGKINF